MNVTPYNITAFFIKVNGFNVNNINIDLVDDIYVNTRREIS